LRSLHYYLVKPVHLHPPIAPTQPNVLSIHGDDRIDPYYWLRDRENPDVIAYLEAENDYAKAMLAHTETQQQQLYDEMLGRIQETDLSVPVFHGGYYYYTRTEEGKAYPIHCRKQGSLDAPETILIDENRLAEGQEFFDLGDFEPSPDHRLLAYSTDTSGAERYCLLIQNLETGHSYPEQILDVGSIAWATDNQTLFYTKLDEAQRPYQLWRHRLNTEPAQDTLLYEEADDAFYLDIELTRSEAFLLLMIDSKITSEVHYLDAQTPDGTFQVIEPRRRGIEYHVEHWGEQFYILINESAINFQLMQTPISATDRSNWQIVIPHDPAILLEDVDAYAHHLVISERRGGLPNLRIQNLSTGQEQAIAFPEPTYAVYAQSSPEFNTNILRFTYTSLITPTSVFDHNMDTQAQELKKETPVLGGYDRTQYASEWLMATAQDGVQIPISIVYRKGITKTGQNPLHLYGYGSYGYAYPVSFSSNRLSLLDRGVVCAIAHIRGGGELGRQWYEDGKFLQKQNTFTDFIACAEYLIQEQWTTPAKLAISGGSAGGLLMGAVLNAKPELFQAAIAQVPFVDVVTTILDPDLPLSVIEWDEWGNPNEPEFYDYMKSYSPYDNVKAQNYPHLLITAGLNDPRVSYWEPAKWTAKLRTLKTDQNVLLLKTNMGAGHGGASGRYERLKEIAYEYGFLLNYLGLLDNHQE
jgi:oligopeptidase B